jgi:hypothetical protein
MIDIGRFNLSFVAAAGETMMVVVAWRRVRVTLSYL